MDAAGGHIQWTNAMSTFVLTYLSDLVRNGNRTNFVCKQVHLNGCAKALNGSLGCQVSGTQVSNHLRKWKKLYKKMKRLQNISAALWDEDTCTITLDAGHYQEYIKDHKDDANFLNTPLEHYREMETIFDNAMATGKYAKGSNEALGTDFIDLEKVEASNGAANEQGCASEAPTESCNNGEATTSSNIGGQSSASKLPAARRARIGADDGGQSSTSQPPTRRARISGDDDLGYMLLSGLEKLSDAIVQTATASVDSELPKDLYDNLMVVPGFDEAYLVHYYAYLCDHSSVARVFNRLSGVKQNGYGDTPVAILVKVTFVWQKLFMNLANSTALMLSAVIECQAS
ncbi:uncharacterized protein LOC101763315 [Setaria italica]|uniref:uncharacterized protein LOC101763315 n=1 Tax=Setaria italica TaxID=4555 RepID=UPI000646C2EF|nr:uncharacterized protein LOC101763315 [Setaria italica]